MRFSVHPQNLPEQGAGLASGGRFWYRLSASSPVRVSLFDARGRLVLQMLNASQTRGYHEVALPADLSGAYVLEFKADGFTKSIDLLRL